MSPTGGNLSPLEPAACTSPAQHALRERLDASPGLTRKKSWFGSLRDIVQKGALQAKAAVDLVRGEHILKRVETPSSDLDTQTSALRKSFDSEGTATPQKPRPELSFSHKNAVQSLRSHLRHSNKYKRASINTVINRQSHDVQSPASQPRRSIGSRDDALAHTVSRGTNLANGLVGSLRGLRRMTTGGKAQRPSFDMVYPPAVPLPSSPISIPAPVPALSLDLGPPGLTANFSGSSTKLRRDDMKALQDPANFTSARPSVENGSSPNMNCPKVLRFALKSRKLPATPKSFLQLRNPECESQRVESPPTPLPGTTFSMDVDGHCSESSQVFKRAVEPRHVGSTRSLRGLREMSSLDAMADACAVAHQTDDLEQAGKIKIADSIDAMAEASTVAHRYDDAAIAAQRQLDEEQMTLKEALRVPAPLTSIVEGRTISSTSTTDTLPADMEDLSRCLRNDQMQAEQPPTHADEPVHHNHGPPSPDRSINLPIRPKPTIDDEAAGISHSPSSSPLSRQLLKPQVSASPVVFRPFLDRAARELGISRHESTPLYRQPPISEAERHTEELSLPQESGNYKNAQEQQQGARTTSLDIKPHVQSSPLILSNAQVSTTSVITDYEEFKSQQQLTQNLHIHSPPSPRASLSGRSGLVPQLYNYISSPASSTRSIQSGLSDVREAFWRLSVTNWLVPGAEQVPLTGDTQPQRQVSETITESSSAETERSPLSLLNEEDYLPLLENRLEFERRRSLRNARYNEINTGSSTPIDRVSVESDAKTDGPLIELDGATSDDISDGSNETTPQQRSNTPSMSHVSIAGSLQEAVLANNTLQARLDSPEPEAEPEDLALFSFLSHVKPSNERLNSRVSPRCTSPNMPRRGQRTNRFEIFNDIDAESLSSTRAIRQSTPDLTTTSPLLPATTSHSKLLGDSLDDDLNLFTSPASGYKADESSGGMMTSPADIENRHESKTMSMPSRYRRSLKRKQLGEIERNAG